MLSSFPDASPDAVTPTTPVAVSSAGTGPAVTHASISPVMTRRPPSSATSLGGANMSTITTPVIAACICAADSAIGPDVNGPYTPGPTLSNRNVPDAIVALAESRMLHSSSTPPPPPPATVKYSNESTTSSAVPPVAVGHPAHVTDATCSSAAPPCVGVVTHGSPPGAKSATIPGETNVGGAAAASTHVVTVVVAISTSHISLPHTHPTLLHQPPPRPPNPSTTLAKAAHTGRLPARNPTPPTVAHHTKGPQ